MINPHFTNDINHDRLFTVAFGNIIATLEKILSSGEGGPDATFWHIDKPAHEALTYQLFGFRKFKWALILIVNLRGIRWNYQVKNVPPVKGKDRRTFLLTQTINLAYFALMSDILDHLGIRWFFTNPNGQVGALNSKYLTLRHATWDWSFARTLVMAVTPYHQIGLQYTLSSIIAVSLGVSKPEVGDQTSPQSLVVSLCKLPKAGVSDSQDWPPNFGKLKNVTTVRKCWGVFWHQALRRVCQMFPLLPPIDPLPFPSRCTCGRAHKSF